MHLHPRPEGRASSPADEGPRFSLLTLHQALLDLHVGGFPPPAAASACLFLMARLGTGSKRRQVMAEGDSGFPRGETEPCSPLSYVALPSQWHLEALPRSMCPGETHLRMH